MSQHIGHKGKNHVARPRKKPTTSDIARNIEARKRFWSLKALMGNAPTKREDPK